MKNPFRSNQSQKGRSLRTVLNTLTWKAKILLPLICLILFSALAISLNYKFQGVICGLTESQLETASGLVGRELALGQENTAQEIFGEFKNSLEKMNLKENLFLVPDNELSKGIIFCKPNFFSSTIDYPISFAGEKQGKIHGTIRYDYNFLYLLFPLIVIGLFIFTIRLLNGQILTYIRQEIIEPIFIISNGDPLINKDHGVKEIFQIEKNLEQLKERISAQAIEEFETKKAIELSKFASQVAHDIRSPLTALEMYTRTAKDISSEDGRLIIRSSVGRIKDIANSLIIKQTELQENKTTGTKETTSVQLLPSMMDVLITEKRLQFRSKKDIEIEYDMNRENYGLFAEIEPIEFKRAISNLINNAIEAIKDKGFVKVKISLENQPKFIRISIEDNGKGISSDILSKLGQRGATFGKEKGLGLGLYHAITSVEKWGGKIKIVSQVDKGTKVILTIPQAKTPEWFLPVLKIEPKIKIVVLDDDSSIHQIWRGRIDSLFPDKEMTPEILHFSTPNELISWHGQNNNLSTIIYLCDYEILGDSKTGLDAIQYLGIAKQSILVTSRFEEPSILETCEKLGIKLIPKSMAGFVKIEVIKPMEASQDNFSYCDFAYIEDDSILRMAWEKRAKKRNVKLLTFESISKFNQNRSQICKENTAIYIDSNLGEGEMRGEDFAVTLHQEDFKNLFIASGYSPENFPQHPWLKFSGKECPF